LSSDLPTAAYPPSGLLEAAESLAKTFIHLCCDGSAICSGCQRGSLDGILRHADDCAPGRTLALAAWLENYRARTSESGAPIGPMGVGCDFCRAFAGDPCVDSFGAINLDHHPSRHIKARLAHYEAMAAQALERLPERLPERWISFSTPSGIGPSNIERAFLDAPERTVVCGAEYPGRRAGVPPATCDKEIGHDADAESSHWNKADGFSWPTSAKIASEWRGERNGLEVAR
jgi:hypothetical protein